MLLTCFCVLSIFTAVSSGFISTPGIQRKSPSESCTFQWATTGPVTNVKVFNHTLGTATDLSASASYTYDNRTGVISLTISYVRLWDAGNYSASVTTGITSIINSGALLFVYGYSSTLLEQTAGPDPPTEGDAVELSCDVQLTSVPAAYRPPLYYFWHIKRFGTLRNISSGPALFPSGDVYTGYSIKDNGQTLAIASAQYQDTGGIYCYGLEEGCPDTYNSAWFYLPLSYRPHITSRSPASGKYNPALYQSVFLSFDLQAEPEITSMTNWSFVSADGHSQDLPSNAVSSTSYSSAYLIFNFTSVSYYGSYSCSATNSIGSTTTTFQVLPQGPPDQPLSFKVIYTTHAEIGLEYSCGWDNGIEQTIFVQLHNIDNEAELHTWNNTLSLSSFNSTTSTTFEDNIEADKEYEARAWASNALGKSDVVKLRVRTTKKLKFNVSPETIKFNGSQAIINFTTSDGNVSRLAITCCNENTGICQNYDFSLYKTNGDPTTQVTCDNIPKGNDYLFDFVAYAGNRNIYEYFATMIKGMKVSRTGIVNDVNPLQTPVIVLGLLFGVTLIAFIGCLIALLYYKRVNKNNVSEDHLDKGVSQLIDETEMKRRPKSVPESLPKSPPENSQPEPKRTLPNPKQLKAAKPKPTAAAIPAVEDEQETYEVMEKNQETCDEMYTPLDQPPPTRIKRNIYS